MNYQRCIRIYYAAPYSNPYPIHNTHNAVRMWDWLWSHGYIPTCPHWTMLQDLILPRPYEEWIEYDNLVVPLHHAVLRGEGESSGADNEVKLAIGLGQPVFYSKEELFVKLPPDTDPQTLLYNPIKNVGTKLV